MCTISLKEQFNHVGYRELCDNHHTIATYDALYACFDELILFFQAHPAWAQKLYIAKERFIRTKNKHYYSTDFFGFYDESKKEGRNQIAFYYSSHFHDFIFSQYPEFKQVLPFVRFFEMCRSIQEASRDIFVDAAAQLGLESIFSSSYGNYPVLLKVVKYFPAYNPSRPHYDGTAFSLFLDSTDNQSLLLSSYKTAFTVDDFCCPIRKFSRSCNCNSVLLVPGTLVTEFSLYRTPHIVTQSGKTRYATIAFAMRPYYTAQNNSFSLLPNFTSS